MTDRRKALGLGLAASALALSGRGKARAADALTIDPGGVKIDNLTVAKSLTVDGGTNLGNVSVNGAATLAMNENHIRLKHAGDHQHGLAYRSKFATIEPDGAVLWGFKGGALATVKGGTSEENAVKKVALSWNQEDVSVHGSLTVSGLFVPGGQEQLRIIRGVVGKDGKKFAGEGFDVNPVSSGRGLYEITFKPAFSSIPGASATQIFQSVFLGNQVATDQGGKTTDNAVISHLSADRMRVKTGNGNGDEEQRAFTFIVIGPR